MPRHPGSCVERIVGRANGVPTTRHVAETETGRGRISSSVTCRTNGCRSPRPIMSFVSLPRVALDSLPRISLTLGSVVERLRRFCCQPIASRSHQDVSTTGAAALVVGHKFVGSNRFNPEGVCMANDRAGTALARRSLHSRCAGWAALTPPRWGEMVATPSLLS